MTFLENSLHKLKERGIYIVEDLTPTTKNNFNNILKDLKKYDLSYINIISTPILMRDNCLLLIQK